MNNIRLFQDKKIHFAWNEEEQQWHFSIVDVAEALTHSVNEPRYTLYLGSNDSRGW